MSRFLFVGNALWLDYVNTEIISDGRRVDLLQSGERLKDWMVESGAVEAEDAQAIENWNQFFNKAIAFRSDLRILAEQLSQHQMPSGEVVQSLNAVLANLTPALVEHAGEWLLDLQPSDSVEGQSLTAIARSAAEVMAERVKGLVRKCEGADCILFFYDTSKNHKRRWCSMSGCGNRHKAAAHYRRSKSAAVEPELRSRTSSDNFNFNGVN